MQKHLLTRRYLITGSRRSSNFFLAALTFFGGMGFLFRGFLSFRASVSAPPHEELLGVALSSFSRSTSIDSLPGGLIMCFYGALGSIFGMYLWLTILWKVGSGFNEFNGETGVVRIFRWGLPGRDRQISLVYPIEDVTGLRVGSKRAIDPGHLIALQLRAKSEIPLTRIGQPIDFEAILNGASELARFLKVEIEVVES